MIGANTIFKLLEQLIGISTTTVNIKYRALSKLVISRSCERNMLFLRTFRSNNGFLHKVRVNTSIPCAGDTFSTDHLPAGKGVLKVPLGEEHQQEVHTPNMFFLPAREDAKMVHAEGICIPWQSWRIKITRVLSKEMKP